MFYRQQAGNIFAWNFVQLRCILYISFNLFNFQSILSEMSAADIKPNLGTFNSVLYVLSRNFRFKETPSLVLQTINEMRALDLGKSPNHSLLLQP